MSDEERRDNPIHDAADLVPVARAVLKRLYPARGKREIKERAIVVAALLERASVDKLKRHLRRPAGDRRRVG